MKKKNLLVTILIIAMVAMFAMPMSVYAVPTPDTYTYNLNQNQPSSLGYKEGDAGNITTGVAWHFVLNQLDGEMPASIDVLFKNEGLKTNITPYDINKNMQHFYVGTEDDDQIISATATSIYANAGNFNLSHVHHFGEIKGLITISKDVIYDKNPKVSLNDSHEFAYTYIEINSTKEADQLISGGGIISETTSHSIPLPLGTYEFTEITVDGDGYTGVTTSITKTINLDDLTKNVKFINSIPTPTMGSITITKDVIYAGHPNISLNDSKEFAYTYIEENADKPVDELISGGGIVSETTASSITLPFGKYIFTETTVDGDGYTGVTTTVTKTIDLDNLTKNIKFINSIPTPTMGSVTVTKDVIYAGHPDISLNDSHEFAYTYIEINNIKQSDQLISGSGIVSETTASSITLPFGKYKFTETTVDGDGYTGVTTSVKKTINLENLTTDVQFVNSIPVATEGSITVLKNVVGSNGTTDITDNANFTFTYVSGETTFGPFDFSENNSKKIEKLSFGTYIFTETPLLGDTPAYTEINYNQGKVYIVTISETSPEGIVIFTNKLNEYDDTDEETGGNDDPIIKDFVPEETPLGEKIPVIEDAQNDDPVVILEEPVAKADAVPQTGDSNNILLLLGLLFASGTGIVALGRRKEAK